MSNKKCKCGCKVGWTIVIILLCIALIYAVYGFGFRKSAPKDASAEQVAAILAQNDCFVCHAQEPKLPFYASFPVMDKMMAKHCTNALHYTNLVKVGENLAEISEPELAKLEQTALSGSMPIKEYRMVHWGTGFNKKEKAVIAHWVKAMRAERFNNNLAAEQFANEPVRPLVSSVPVDSAKVVLGEKLYNDTRLSQDATVSCADCHILKEGGADDPDHRTSEGINGQFGGVNAPTVYNAYFNVQQFWNGRAADLAAQAAGPPVNPVEMGSWTWDDIVAGLKQDKALVKEFEAIYPEGLTANTVCDAIAEFEKTLLTPDAPFDLYLKGDENAITDAQKAGYQDFKMYNCATCHVGTLIGGQSFEYLGVNEDYFAARDPQISCGADDDGLAGFTGNASDLRKFKVPTLRNITLTAPYYHDGSKATLEEAVTDMIRFESSLKVDQKKVASICDFLTTLTGVNPYLEAK